MNFDVRDQGKGLTLAFLSKCADDMYAIEDNDDPRKWSNVEGIVITPEQKELFFVNLPKYRDKTLIVEDYSNEQ